MTMPAEVTSDAAWDRLVVTLRAQYRDIDDLVLRITEPREEDGEPDTTEEELVAELDTYPFPDDDWGADHRAAELEQERRVRLDAETDGELDGDCDREPYDEPGLEG